MEEYQCLIPIIIGFVVFCFVVIIVISQSNLEEKNKKYLLNQLEVDGFKVDKSIEIKSPGVNKQLVIDYEKKELVILNGISKSTEKLSFNNKADKVYEFHSQDIHHVVVFDLINSQIIIIDGLKNSLEYIDFEKILECKIIEDNSTIAEGGVGRAILGGVIAGGVGAIVGANTRGTSDIVKNLSIRIITKDIENSLIMITIINNNTKRDSVVYKSCMTAAHGIYSTIINILEIKNKNISKEAERNGKSDISHQIREIAKLKEDGLITEDEYNRIKKGILNL